MSCRNQQESRKPSCGSIRSKLLADAVANFECELVTIYQPGDCPLVIGKVVVAHVNEDASLRRLYTIGPKHALGGA